MALFLNQNEKRTQLQEKIAADLAERVKVKTPGGHGDVGEGILEETKEATGRSLLWVTVVTIGVLALVVFVLFIFNGV